MSNFLLKDEAKRISKKLVEIYADENDLDTIFHKLLDKKYINDDMKVLVYISDALYELGYAFESVQPFKLKRI